MRIRTKICLLLAGALVVTGCSKPGDSGNNNQVGPPQKGGELTVLLDSAFSGSWPSGLDPATNTTGGGNLTQMSAIYGGLFRLVADDDGSNAKVVPHQAASYEFADGGQTVRIKIKPGIKFTDGTSFDAAAVAFNFKRDMTSTCTCKPTLAAGRPGPHHHRGHRHRGAQVQATERGGHQLVRRLQRELDRLPDRAAAAWARTSSRSTR